MNVGVAFCPIASHPLEHGMWNHTSPHNLSLIIVGPRDTWGACVRQRGGGEERRLDPYVK